MNDKDDRALCKILIYIEDVAQYIDDLEFDSFLQDKKTERQTQTS